MKQKILSLSLAAMLIGGVSVQAVASPSSQISENKTKYKELSSQIMNLNSQVSTLNAQIENLNKVTNDNDLKMKDIENQIAETKTKISSVQEDIQKKEQALGVRISAMYKSQLNFSPLVFLLTSNNLGEFLSRLNAFQRIISLDDTMINSLKESKSTLDNDIASLNKQEASLKTLQDSAKKNIDELNQKKQEQEQSIAQLNAQKATVLSTIEANENELISYAVNIINSSNPNLTDLENAKQNLQGMLPQLSIDSVRNQATQAIDKANGAITTLKQEAAQKAAAEAAAQKAAADAAAQKAKEDALAQQNNNTNTTPPTTGNASDTSSSNSGSGTSSYKKVLQVEATAYTGGTLTAMGLKPVRDPSGISTIAVDPSVIPLGSKVYIPGYGYAIASDTGGAIKGNIIDLYMNSESACTTWGRRPVTLYIVAYPGQW